MVLDLQTLLIAFLVPTITAIIIFVGQWHKKGSLIEISSNDIHNMKRKMDDIENKLDDIVTKINKLCTIIEVFRYRISALERIIETLENISIRHTSRMDDMQIAREKEDYDNNNNK